MPTEVVIRNSVLDGRNSVTNIAELFDPPIADKENSKFLLGHGGVEQVKTHGGLEADVKIKFDETDGWGITGGEVGKEFARLIAERGESTYRVGNAIVPFGKNVSIAAIRASQNPKVHFYLDTDDLINERDKEIADKVKRGVGAYLGEFVSSLGAELFILSAPFERFRSRGLIPYGDSLADIHHRVEDLFKALGNALRQYKARVSIGLGGDSLEPRIDEKSTKHGEATIQCRLNLDGEGNAEIDLQSHLDREYIRRFAAYQKALAERALIDFLLQGYSIDRHHLVEDQGSPQGRAFKEALLKNPLRLVRFGNDFYVDNNRFVLAAIGASNRYSFVGNYTPEFMKTNDTTLHYLEQMLQDAGWETYLHVGSPDFQQMPFSDNTAYEILYEVFKPNSPYRRPVNTIIPYEGQTIEDPGLALFYVLGGAIRMGTRIDRSQPEGIASSKGVIY